MSLLQVPDVKRWKARTLRVLESMPWVWFEPVDIKDAVIGPRVDNTSAQAEDLEELELDTGRHESVTALLSLMLKAQDVALCRQAQAYNAMLENNQALLQTVSNRLQASERHQSELFEQVMEMRQRLVNAETGDSSDDQMALEVMKLAAQSGHGASQSGPRNSKRK